MRILAKVIKKNGRVQDLLWRCKQQNLLIVWTSGKEMERNQGLFSGFGLMVSNTEMGKLKVVVVVGGKQEFYCIL